jgi:hypothetical protein
MPAPSAETLPVRVTAKQTLDLDGDGSIDATRSDSESVRLSPTTIPQLIQPRDGIYAVEQGESLNTNFHVEDGNITLVYGASQAVLCANLDYDISVPIDPSTGAFTVDVPNQPVRLLGGQFEPGGGIGAVARVEITSGAEPSYAKCKWSDPNPSDFFFHLFPFPGA